MRTLPHSPTRKTAAKGKWFQCFACTNMCLSSTEAVLLGGDIKYLAHSMILLPCHRASSSGRCPNHFKCLTHAHTILISLILSLKEKEERWALTHLGSSYWGRLGSRAFRTCQGVMLARVPQLLPLPLTCSKRVKGGLRGSSLPNALLRVA